MTGEELDELVLLYQRATTDLSVVRSATPDPALIGRLSTLVADARASVTGANGGAWDSFSHFIAVRFPAEVYRLWRWWVSVAVVFVAVSFAFGWWIATHRHVQASLLPPDQVKQLVQSDFKNYYSDHPAHDFALHVWINNAWVAALSLVSGVLLGIPTVLLMYNNALNVGVSAGYMVAAGHGAEFFGLILPHGTLELTALFIASGVGLKLGWTVVDPGPRSRADALAQEGRSAGAVALGLVLVLCVSGMLEGFVTPSPLPTSARIAIGIAVWMAFLTYIVVFGRRAVAAGELGDVSLHLRAELAPTSG
ncbi:stage II sporulation protein M [Acidothermaceae bacterium B102]|nr:stage II sporulation protein M [Acidothermaceae bacterium B102]